MNVLRLHEYDHAFMKMAEAMASLSHCNKAKVGAIITVDNRVVSGGYNGTPQGFCNECEGEDGRTDWRVIHAEMNAVLTAAQSRNNMEGCTVYTTISPCKDCAKALVQIGVFRVVYGELYRDAEPLEFLGQCGVLIQDINDLKISEASATIRLLDGGKDKL